MFAQLSTLKSLRFDRPLHWRKLIRGRLLRKQPAQAVVGQFEFQGWVIDASFAMSAFPSVADKKFRRPFDAMGHMQTRAVDHVGAERTVALSP